MNLTDILEKSINEYKAERSVIMDQIATLWLEVNYLRAICSQMMEECKTMDDMKLGVKFTEETFKSLREQAFYLVEQKFPGVKFHYNPPQQPQEEQKTDAVDKC